MSNRTIVLIAALAGVALWIARGSSGARTAEPSNHEAFMSAMDLYQGAKLRLDDARAAFARRDLDDARRALVAATTVTPGMERHLPSMGPLLSSRIVEGALDLIDAHPELDAAARREILEYAQVTPTYVPSTATVREELEHAGFVAARLAAERRAAAE